MDRRRLLVAGLATLAAPAVARAQTTTGGCTVGFRNGLLQFDPTCATLRLPGLPMSVSPPSHLVGPIDDGTVTTQNRKAAKHDNRHT